MEQLISDVNNRQSSEYVYRAYRRAKKALIPVFLFELYIRVSRDGKKLVLNSKISYHINIRNVGVFAWITFVPPSLVHDRDELSSPD